jgi:transposase
MEFNYFIGIDVSKNELDFAVQKGNVLLFHKEIGNEVQSIKALGKELEKLPDFDWSKAVFCLEHTGIYNNHLLGCLYKKKAHVCLEAATHIKNSLGNLRGKNDKVDSMRIAQYAYKNRDELRLWAPKREIIQQLAHLTTTRCSLIEAKKILTVPLKEKNSFVKKSIVSQNLQLTQRTLNSIESDLSKVEKAIDQVIQSDPTLKHLFGLITSVNGVGKVTATQIIITTNEFKDIKDPKKFACYSGVAPFTQESGLFKGKARVSPLANKKLKTLLHLAALTAIQYNQDLQRYFQRKLEENKNKMSIINAVRNKLILRIFACVNQNRKYENIYTKPIA